MESVELAHIQNQLSDHHESDGGCHVVETGDKRACDQSRIEPEFSTNDGNGGTTGTRQKYAESDPCCDSQREEQMHFSTLKPLKTDQNQSDDQSDAEGDQHPDEEECERRQDANEV